MHFDNDVLFSNRTYRAYYVKKNQFANDVSMNIGLLSFVDIGRWKFSISGSSNNQTLGAKFTFQYPVADEQFEEYYSRIQFSEFVISPTVIYILTPDRSLPLFVEAGWCKAFPLSLKEDFSSHKDFSKLWKDVHELRDDINMDTPYNKYLFGIGGGNSMMSVSLRYYIKFNYDVLNENIFSYFTINFSFYSNFSKLRKNELFFL